MNLVATGLLWFAAVVSLYFAVFWFLVLLDGDRPAVRRKWKEWPLVTVAIPAWNEEQDIEGTLRSVLALDYPADRLEIIVVDDGSKDGTVVRAQGIVSGFPGRDVRIISQENGGKGSALNTALARAKGEFFVTMDVDSFIQKDGLKRLLAYFVDRDIAAVMPLMAVHEPKSLLQKMQWTEYIVNMFYKTLMGRLDCLHVVPGPFPVYRTEALRKVGMFDADHNLTEDLEMAYRLQKNQYRLVQATDVTAMTKSPFTFREFYAQRNRWFKGAVQNTWSYRKLLFDKAYGDFGMIQLPTVLLAGVLSLILFSQLVYYSAKPVLEVGYRLWFVDFDIWTLLRNFSLDLHALDIDYMAVLLSVAMLGMSAVILWRSHRMMSARVSEQGWISLVGFLFAYYLVLGVAWVGVFVDLVRGRRQKW